MVKNIYGTVKIFLFCRTSTAQVLSREMLILRIRENPARVICRTPSVFCLWVTVASLLKIFVDSAGLFWIDLQIESQALD